MLCKAGVAKIIGFAPCGYDQVVIGKISNGGNDGVVFGFHAEHFGHPYLQVFPVLKYFSEREGDAAGLKLRRGYLVKQRLKLMVIEFVDQQNIEHIFIQVLYKLNACKPATDNYDFFSVHLVKNSVKTNLFNDKMNWH
jgi:hypothetical protein